MADVIVEQTPDTTTEPVVESTPTPEPEVAPITGAPATEGESAPTEEPKQTRFQRRIDQMTRKIHDLERKLETTTRPTEPHTASAPEQEPQEGDFTDYGQYLKALARHEVRQQQIEARREAVTQQQQQQIAELSRNFEPQIQAARAKYEDFDEVIAQPLFSPMTQEMLLHSPQGAEIAYFLGTNPQEALKLNALSPVVAAREIIKLEGRFAVQPKTVSSAPEPITPLTGSAPAVKDPNKMTTEEWMAHEKQQRIERLKAKPF